MSPSKPKITDIKLTTDTAYVCLCCSECGFSFESMLTTVSGLAMARPKCPKCGAINEIEPEDFAPCLDRCLPLLAWDSTLRLSEEATRIAETWHQNEAISPTLDYHGVNLGQSAERELVTLILQSLYEAHVSAGAGSYEPTSEGASK